MDGETLCLTGKVTDCWQPVDGTQENASFYLKDLSIEADASSFVFQGIRRKRPITCHRYPVRQMRTRCQFLFLLRKQPHKSMKCRKYSGKTRVHCAICRKTKRFQRQAAMFGFSAKCRHFAGNESWRIRRSSLLSEKRLPVCAEKNKNYRSDKNYGRLEEFLSQLRYESEVLFRKLLGEKNGATASAMVLGRKKEWTAK